MNKTDMTKIANTFVKGVRKKAPAIAIGVGIGCFGCAVISSIKETPKAVRLIEAKKKELELEEDEKLPATELFKAVWKCYVPMGISFTAGALCILGAHKIDSTRNAALAAAYQLSETAFREYKNKVVETIGENKEKMVRDEVAKDKVKENQPIPSQIIVTGRGKTRCYDGQTGRYFESDIESIRKIINKLNYRLQSEHYISLNEFFYELNLPNTDIGDLLGWNLENGLIDVNFTSMLPDDGIPTLVLDYNIAPRYEYRY